MKTMAIFILLGFIISCTNKPRQKEVSQTPADTANGIDDTLQTVVIDTAIILFPYLLTKAEDSKEAYLTLTEKPEFPGGMHALITFIQKNIQYPSDAYETGKQGRVIVQATIDTDGSVIQPSIIYSVDSLLDKEALRIIQSMPKWKPGKYHGKEVKVKYHFPVTFRITDNNTHIASSSTDVKTTSDMHWGYLIGENEGAVKIYFNRHINQKCREETDDIAVDGTRISKGKVYVSLVSSKAQLTYDKAEFYREDSQGKLHKMPQDESIGRESVALVMEKGKAREIGVDFPENCPTGDYLLKIKLHNEQQERYEVYQWFEAYTSRRVSRRKRPVELEPLLYSNTLSTEDDEVYEVVENMPEFPGGGMPKLMEFIQNNLQYDKARGGNGIKKRVIVQVIIDTDGTVTRPVILRGVSPALDKEALRVVKMMPKWKPGSQHGVPLKVKFTFPVTFEINPI